MNLLHIAGRLKNVDLHRLFVVRAAKELPQTLAQAGVAPGKVWGSVSEIVECVLSDPCCKTNPVPVEDFQVRRILEEVTGHL